MNFNKMVMVKLTDTKTSTTYQLELSLEDFQKAQKDNQYKKKLLNDAIALCQNDSEMTEIAAKEDNGSDDEQDVDEPDEETQQNVEDILGEVSRVLNDSESRSEANISAAIDYGDNGIRWGKEAIYLLLTIYRMKDSSGVFTNGKLSQKACWDMIAKDMTKHGHSFSWLQCQNKLISLKKSYRKIKLSGKKSNWQYFDIMDDIFSGKSFYQPINVASSSDYTKILIRRQKEAAAKAGAPRSNFGAESSSANFRAKLVKSDNTGLIEILERHLESLRRQRAERDERREAEKRRLELQKREDRLRFAEERRKDRARLIELLEKRCKQCDEI